MVTTPIPSFESTARALADLWLEKRLRDDHIPARAADLLARLEPGLPIARLRALSESFESLRAVTIDSFVGASALTISEAHLRSVQAIGWSRATRLAEAAWAWARGARLDTRAQALALLVDRQKADAANADGLADIPPLERAWPQLALSTLYSRQGQHDQALACGLGAEAQAIEADCECLRSLTAQSLAFVCLTVGDVEGAQAALSRAIAAERSVSPLSLSLQYNQLLVMVLARRFREAGEWLNASPELERAAAQPRMASAKAIVARVRLSQGRTVEAADLPPEGWSPAGDEPDTAAANRLWLCADVLIGLGRADEARRQLLQGMQDFNRAGVTLLPMNATQLHRALADACEATGDLPAAMAALRQSQAHCHAWVGESMRARLQALHFSAAWDARAEPGIRHDRRMKRAEQALAEVRHTAADEAILAERNKQLLQVTHELRNPMHGVVWMTSMLMMSDLDDRQREYLHLANSSARMALNLCNDVLDLAKLDAGKFELNTAPVDLGALMAECAALFEVPAKAKGVALHTHHDPALPGALLGDGLRLQQVLMNLLSNATKFTDRGRIDLAVSWLGSDAAAAAPTVRLSVSDTGPGVPEELIPRLFQEFEQARTTAPAAAAGAGLGLALCRQFVHLMGGQIGVDNRPGQGSTFWCLLPLQTA
jgi:signal transduction histidine kinase